MKRDVPASYLAAHRYDGAAIEHGTRTRLEPCTIQPRDIAIIRDVWRYKYLTAPQIRELWWPRASVQAADRRLLKLHDAGHLERFRPYAHRGAGSYPWTYHLGKDGHRLLQSAGVIADTKRYHRRPVFDYGHILHEIQLNAWVLAYRRALGNDLLAWNGETSIEPPTRLRHEQHRFDDDWSAEGLSDPRPRTVCPDAIIEIAGDEPAAPTRLILVEYDRTRRLDKNFEKFKRYDAYLTWWWHETIPDDRRTLPFVLFICQDDSQRALFLDAADREITGHRWHPEVEPERYEYTGRERILFTTEIAAHEGTLEAWRLPQFPPKHRARNDDVRRVGIAPTATPSFNSATSDDTARAA